MGNSVMRPETVTATDNKNYCPTGGTAYLMIYTAVKQADGLIHGRLHDKRGAHCAIGNFWEVNPKTSLQTTLIDEVAAVNDSVPHYTPKQRKLHVSKWLRWKLAQLGMPGFKTKEK
jgi:hypothetical protein